MPLVLNKRRDVDLVRRPDAVYVGRPTKWGNPFEIGKDGTREEVIAKHRAWLLGEDRLMRQAREELRGMNLVCWCAPRACHADLLLEIANGTGPFPKA